MKAVFQSQSQHSVLESWVKSMDSCLCGLSPVSFVELTLQESHGAKLKANMQPSGDASLQNALQLALDALATIPPYGNREVSAVDATNTMLASPVEASFSAFMHDRSRTPQTSPQPPHLPSWTLNYRIPEASVLQNVQVVIVFSAMSSCDPGNIQDTIKAAKAAGCRVSIVGLAAEVYICRQIVEVGTVLDNVGRLADMGPLSPLFVTLQQV